MKKRVVSLKQRNMYQLIVFSLCGLLLDYSSLAKADTVMMTNHDTLRGDIVGINQDKLTLKTTYAGDVSIDMRYVKALETSEFLWVRLQGQATYKRIRFTSDKGKIWMNDQKGHKIPLADNRSLARITSTQPDTNWVYTGSADANFNSDDSSGDKQSYGTSGKLTIKNPLNTHNISWNTYYERNNDVVSSRKWNLQYDYQRYLNASIYLQGNASWAYSLDQVPQTLVQAGPGIGYQFWDNPQGSLQSDIGVNHLWEVYRTGDRQTEWALRWDLKYNQNFMKEFNFYQNINLLQPLNNGLILTTESGIKYQLTDNFFLKVEYDYNYTTQEDPSATVGSNRISHIFYFGLGVNW